MEEEYKRAPLIPEGHRLAIRSLPQPGGSDEMGAKGQAELGIDCPSEIVAVPLFPERATNDAFDP